MRIIVTKSASRSLIEMFQTAFENNRKRFGNCPPDVIVE